LRMLLLVLTFFVTRKKGRLLKQASCRCHRGGVISTQKWMLIAIEATIEKAVTANGFQFVFLPSFFLNIKRGLLPIKIFAVKYH